MRRAGWMLAAAMAVPGPAWAQAIHTDHDTLFKSARETGRPALIVYSMETTCPIAIGARDFVLKDAANRRFLAGHFEVAEIPIAKGGRRYADYRGRFPGKFIPFWVAATPEGDFLDGGDCGTIDAGRNSKWRKRIGRIASTHPPIGKKDLQKAGEMLAQARKDMDAGLCLKAHAAAEKVQKVIWCPKELPEQAKQILAEIARRGEKSLAEADRLAEGEKFLDAALAYDRVATSFSPKLPAGKAAAERLRATLNQHKEVHAEFKRKKRIARADALLGRAKQLAEDGKSTAARSTYFAVLSEYADTPAAGKAKEALARMSPRRTAPAAGTTPAPRGEALVKLARSYHAAGMKGKAREKLLACIKAHPASAAAGEARKLLAEWKLPPP